MLTTFLSRTIQREKKFSLAKQFWGNSKLALVLENGEILGNFNLSATFQRLDIFLQLVTTPLKDQFTASKCRFSAGHVTNRTK